MPSLMLDHFLTVNVALCWVWEKEHKQQLGSVRNGVHVAETVSVARAASLHGAGRHAHDTTGQGHKRIPEGDRLLTGGNYERIWNLSLQPLSDELRIALREAWQAGAIPGGPGVQPGDSQYDGPVPDYARMKAWRPGSTQIRNWLERWLEQGGRGSPPFCWNCCQFTIPIGGDHYCTMHSSQVDYLYYCVYWDARCSV